MHENDVDRPVDESEQERARTRGPELGQRYRALWNKVVWLYGKWQEFAKRSTRTPLIGSRFCRGRTAFFGQLRVLMWDDTLLSLARITDRPRSAGRSYLRVCVMAPASCSPQFVLNQGVAGGKAISHRAEWPPARSTRASPAVRRDAVTNGPHCQSCARRHIDFAEDPAKMVVDSVVAQAQSNADLAVGEPFCHELGNLHFAWG